MGGVTKRTRTLILRAVSDVVDREGGEAYGNVALFHERAKTIMKNLAEILPRGSPGLWRGIPNVVLSRFPNQAEPGNS